MLVLQNIYRKNSHEDKIVIYKPNLFWINRIRIICYYDSLIDNYSYNDFAKFAFLKKQKLRKILLIRKFILIIEIFLTSKIMNLYI